MPNKEEQQEQELQQKLLDLSDKMKQLEEQNKQLSLTNEKILSEYNKTKELNKELFLRLPMNETEKEEVKKDEQFSDIVDEFLKDYVEKRFKNNKEK